MQINSYKKKNGSTAYGFRIYIGKVDGKDKYIKRRGFSTKGKARSALLQLQEEIESRVEQRKDITVKEIGKRWLDEYIETVQESTYIKTERNIKNHIYPKLGDSKIADLTPLKMQEMVKEWTTKLVYGRKLKGLMSNLFKYAIRYGYITNNPMDSVVTPARKRAETKIDFYDKEELKTFLKYVEETNNLEQLAFFRLLAFSGARKQEMLAFRWSDLVKDTIQVNRAITRGFTGEEVGLPKTYSSKRLISLDQTTLDILKRHYEKNPDNLYIFQANNGKPHPSTLPSKWLQQILVGKDLRPITIHQFRHTHASLCFEAGMTLKQVQHRLGHSDLKTTMNIYTHITQQAIDEIGTKFSNYIDF